MTDEPLNAGASPTKSARGRKDTLVAESCKMGSTSGSTCGFQPWMWDDVGTSKTFLKKSAESNEHVEDVEHMEQDLGNSPGRVPNVESIIRTT